jgi:heme/copper-type cytochrome/quinol oxidase subunit 3
MRLRNAAALRRQDEAQRPARAEGAALEVGALPSFGFGDRSLMWWGTLGLIAIEGSVFALAVFSYFYLRSHSSQWPLDGEPPVLLWGTLNTAILLASLLPNHWTKQAAERLDLRKVRIGLLVCLAMSVVFLGVRVLEFQALNTRWDADAYGSAVWMLLGLHTLHLATDTFDTAVLAVLMFTGPLEGRRYVDVSENALYWYFVVYSWLPLYAVIYWAPRWP